MGSDGNYGVLVYEYNGMVKDSIALGLNGIMRVYGAALTRVPVQETWRLFGPNRKGNMVIGHQYMAKELARVLGGMGLSASE